ncbi:Hypothetical predicted protein [Pelobates cultripes]|uniref:Reverse transcriptase domain-containing protein n=1 Tax=Pelobates cultripes TaxID=61616 RepID=A0AAD1SFI2_PELCU|nr:Hypothetical predicted protein [Pelobates cultripes]
MPLPCISQDQGTYLDTPFTEEELRDAINALPKHKSPSPDGLSNYYYIKFAKQLTPHLLQLINTIKQSGTMPREMLEAFIVTLPKPNKPPTNCANLRPISLLNSDVKLYAKMLATRVKTLFPTFISPEQAGFVPGKQVGDNTRHFINLIDWANHSSQQGLVLALDSEKVFDHLH